MSSSHSSERWRLRRSPDGRYYTGSTMEGAHFGPVQQARTFDSEERARDYEQALNDLFETVKVDAAVSVEVAT